MDSEIGCYLQQLRTVRQISTSQLARGAGIGRATLNRWQAGKCWPRLQELEAVLKAMAVSPMEHAHALTLLSSARKHIRKDAGGEQNDYALLAGRQPHCGDLLRALRRRSEMTQAEMAQLVGTTQATVARWERGETWPNQERLHQAALALHAQDAELAALLPGPLLAVGPPPCVEDLREEWQVCRQGPHPPGKAVHAELTLLKLAAQAWLSARSSRALKLLADIYTVYADHLYFQCRFPECVQTARRAQHIYVGIGNEADPFWAGAILRGSSALAQQGNARTIRRVMGQLRIDFPGDSPAIYKDWMLSELGKMAALCGRNPEALHLGREAVSLARESSDLTEFARIQENLARIYL